MLPSAFAVRHALHPSVLPYLTISCFLILIPLICFSGSFSTFSPCSIFSSTSALGSSTGSSFSPMSSSSLPSAVLEIGRYPRPGIGIMGHPWTFSNSFALPCSPSGILLTSRHFTTPLALPMITSSVSKITPSQLPSSHLGSSLFRRLAAVFAGFHITCSPNLQTCRCDCLPFTLW